jgi:hypothetical protein
MSRFADGAAKALKDFEAKLTSDLIALGYDDPVEKPMSPTRVINDFLMRHPMRKALWMAATAASDRMHGSRLVARNRESIVAVRAQIRENGRQLAGLPVGAGS